MWKRLIRLHPPIVAGWGMAVQREQMLRRLGIGQGYAVVNL